MASVSKRHWTHKGVAKEAWVCRWVDRLGKHRQKTFIKKRDADGHRAKLDVERVEGRGAQHIEARSIAQLARDYSRFEDRRYEEGQIKRGHLKNIVQALNTSILPRLGKLNAPDLSPLVVERWYEALRNEDGLSIATARERIVKLSAMLDYGRRRGMLRENVASLALANLGRAPKTRIRILTVAEVGAVLRVARERRRCQHEHTWRLTNVAVNLAVACGLRIGEILALRLGDVDLSNRLVFVRHTLNEWDELTSPKTPSSVRTVPAPEHVVDLLRLWIKDYYLNNDREMIFRRVISRVGCPGGAIGVRGFNIGYWRPITEAAGIDKNKDHVHFHALRHFAASWWLSNNMPPADVAKLMGHSSPAVTLGIYSHALSDQAERATSLDTFAAALSARVEVQGAHNTRKTQQNQQDENLNYMVAKKRSTEKVDGIAAGVMAVGVALFGANDDGPSIYETRGILEVEV